MQHILSYALREPPRGLDRWSTRTIAADSGLSQATVSRIRHRIFPAPDTTLHTFADSSAVSLVHVEVSTYGTVLAFQRTSRSVQTRNPVAQLVDAVETVVCASLLRRPSEPSGDGVGTTQSGTAPTGARGALREGAAGQLLRRTVERLPTLAATLLVDVPLDDAARRWLRQYPELEVRPLLADAWFASARQLAAKVDARQLPDLRHLQHDLRVAHARGNTEFSWTRRSGGDPLRSASPGPTCRLERVEADLETVVSTICSAIAEGTLFGGDEIPARTVARRAGMPLRRAEDALEVLASSAIVERRDRKLLVPNPGPSDVIETYTARGLLGTVIHRRLASSRQGPPPAAEAYLRRIRACTAPADNPAAYSLDLDFQDAIARAADSPRITSMFVRLTLQLRLFTAIIGLHYDYPVQEIIADAERLLLACRSDDPDVAVHAWRRKTDNVARRMLECVENMRVASGTDSATPERTVRRRDDRARA